MQKLFFTRTFLAFCGIFHGKKSEKIVHFSRHRNSFSRPKKTLLVPTHLCIFFCLFLCLTVFRSARMSSQMKNSKFPFFGFIYFITSFARNFCELFYRMCNWIPRRRVQVGTGTCHFVTLHNATVLAARCECSLTITLRPSFVGSG